MMIKKKLSILILTLICIISTTIYADTCDEHDYTGDDGGNEGEHATGTTCSHGIGDTSYHDYTCYETSSADGYHMQHCTGSSCSKQRPKGGKEREHNSSSSCYDCGAYERCSSCDHVWIHDCTPAVTYVSAPYGVNRTYNGSSQSGVAGGSGYGYYWGGMTSATDAGTYTAYAYLYDGYAWDNGSTSTKTITWTIAKANRSTSTVSISDYTYGGTKSTPSVSLNQGNGTVIYYYNSSKSTSGAANFANINSSSLNAGTYYMYATIGATTNYNKYTTGWTSFKINKASLTKPTVSGTYTYNGKEQTVSLSNFNSNTMNVSNNKMTDAGSQNVTVSLKNKTNYQWSGGSTADLYLNFTIAKKTVAINWGTTTSFVYNGSPQAPTVSVESGVTGETINVSRSTATNVGSYTSTMSFDSVTGGRGKTSNYSLSGSTTKAFTITPKLLTKPTAPGSFTYNGKTQTYIPSGFDSSTMNISNNTRIDAGSQTVTVSLKDKTNYNWSDGTTTDLTYTFTIATKSVAVEWGNTTFTYNGQPQGPTATASSGVTGETLNITRTTETNASDSEYTSTATLSSVTGGRGKKENYTLTNTTIKYKINRKDITPTVINMKGYEYGKTLPTPSVTGNPGNGAVVIYYNTSNSTSGGSNWANVTSGTSIAPGAYWMYATVAQTTNYNAATTPTVKFIVGQPPEIKIDSNTTYKRSQTATITISDPDEKLANMDNDKYLQRTTVTINYKWSQSTATPISWDTTTVLVGANQSVATKEITKNTDSGIWYLHIKVTAKDMIGYTTTTTTYGTFYLDNTKPVITHVKPSGITYYDKNDTIEILMDVKDEHAKTNVNAFTEDDINVYVGGKTLVGNKKLEEENYNEATGIRRYKLTLTNVQGTGFINLTIPEGKVPDNTADEANVNNETSFTVDDVKIFVDNEIPVIELTDQIKVNTPTEKIDLDSPKDNIDPRYINKEYEIEMPFMVTDIGTDIINTNVLEASDIKVLVNGNEIEPEKKELVIETPTATTDSSTKIVTHINPYKLILKGLTGDGYISINIDSGAVTDLVGNTNEAKPPYEPYARNGGTTARVYVDNTKPTIRIEENNNPRYVSGDALLKFTVKITDNGAGITERQFVENDIKPQVNGSNVNKTMILQKDNNNDYDSRLGNDVTSNYTYTIELSGIRENGTLRLVIPENAIVDKANNGMENSTLQTEVIIDNKGPTIGKIITNADEHGRIFDKETELSIEGCEDPSGIAKYEWQVSYDGGVTWEVPSLREHETSLPNSEANHQIKKEQDVYYRVIVSDKLGNTTISDKVKVTFIKSLDMKPTIRLETNQSDNTKVIITAIIKATSDIKEVRVNGENPLTIKPENISQINSERTVKVEYIVTQNGTYEFRAMDGRGNLVAEKINISTIENNAVKLEPKVTNATATSEAKIEFVATSPVRVIDSNKYSNISFNDPNSYLTRHVATIVRGTSYNEDKVFTFETRGKTKVSVVVKAPIITSVVYVRFVNESISSSMDVTASDAKALTDGLTSTSIVIGGKNESYYGFDSKPMNVNVASSDDLDVAEILGGANNIYTITSNNDKKEIKATMDEPQTISGYVNGNATGMVEVDDGKTLKYDDGSLSNSTKYDTFRTVITK